MTPEERADNIVRRCWKPTLELVAAGEECFKGLDKEIAAAIRDALAEEREACAKVAESMHDKVGGPPDDFMAIAKTIRTRGNK